MLKQMLPCLFGALLPTLALAGDWPSHMADASRSGVSATTLTFPLKKAWTFRTKLPPLPAWPDPAKRDAYHKVVDLSRRVNFDRCYHVVGDRDSVYFGSSSTDQLYALDSKTGEKRWSFFSEGPVRLAPTLHMDRLYFGSDDGHVYCISAKNGALVWKTRVGPSDRRVAGNGRIISLWPVRGGTVIFGDRLYVAAGAFPSETVYVASLSLADGSLEWKTGMNDLPAQGYLLASTDRLYVPSGRNNPIVFDRTSGKRLRVLEGQGGSYCLLSGDQVIFGPGIKGQLGLVEGERKDQLATFAGEHMVITPNVSYLQNRGELSALDRTRYLEFARKRRTLRERRAKIEDGLKKLKKAKAKRTPQWKQLEDQVAAIGRG
ncbi:MAG: PQQ-binding-like beta-propeller repeat protein, partial [Planctomycetota bacterium]